MRALIVEDDLRLANLWHETLEQQGIKSSAVHSLAAAREALEQGTFDLFLLDFCVADGTVEALVREIRTQQPEVRILMLTGSRLSRDSGVARASLRADRFLRKPVAWGNSRLPWSS